MPFRSVWTCRSPSDAAAESNFPKIDPPTQNRSIHALCDSPSIDWPSRSWPSTGSGPSTHAGVRTHRRRSRIGRSRDHSASRAALAFACAFCPAGIGPAPARFCFWCRWPGAADTRLDTHASMESSVQSTDRARSCTPQQQAGLSPAPDFGFGRRRRQRVALALLVDRRSFTPARPHVP